MRTIMIAAVLSGLNGCGTVVSRSSDAQPVQGDAARAVDGRTIGSDARADAQQAYDATVLDASTIPPVTNDQLAFLVLGQPDFISDAPNNNGPSGTSLYQPSEVFSYGGQLWIGDDGSNRVLEWPSEPSTLDAAASLVLGQASLTSNSDGTTQKTFTRFSVESICGDGTHLFVTDTYGNRVLMWNSIPAVDGADATLVLGQSTWTDSTAGDAASQMDAPRNCWTDGTHLVVTDGKNSRVLIWNEIPTAMGQGADLELGWSDFGMGAGDAVQSPSASTLNAPIGVVVDGGGRLFVVDSGNNRILVWNSIPSASGVAADYVIGQSDLKSGEANAGALVSSSGFDTPYGIALGSGSLFVSDQANHRIVVFTPPPSSTGAQAVAVLGQPDLLTSTAPSAPAQTNFSVPNGLAVVGQLLWVVDRGYSRAIGYTLSK